MPPSMPCREFQMNRFYFVSICSSLFLLSFKIFAADPPRLDPISAEQAKLEKEQLATKVEQRTLTPAMTEFRQTAQLVHYTSGEWKLPGYLYKPAGNGPFPALMWNHGSEKD